MKDAKAQQYVDQLVRAAFEKGPEQTEALAGVITLLRDGKARLVVVKGTFQR